MASTPPQRWPRIPPGLAWIGPRFPGPLGERPQVPVRTGKPRVAIQRLPAKHRSIVPPETCRSLTISCWFRDAGDPSAAAFVPPLVALAPLLANCSTLRYHSTLPNRLRVPMLRRAIIFVAGLALAACGGDSSGPSQPAYPAVAGTYDLKGSWDQGFPGDTIIGTLTLNQVSRDNGDLTGTLAVTVILAGQGNTLSPVAISAPTVTTGGLLNFGIGSQGTVFWAFTGNLNGTVFTGRHTFISSSGNNLTGDWKAQRIGG
jgi:hypothetical protein